MESLAAQYSVGTHTMRARLKAAGLPTPAKVNGQRRRGDRRGVLATNDIDMIVSAFLRDGRSLADIGVELGVSRERVRQILLIAGVTGKQRPPFHQRGRLADVEWVATQVAQGSSPSRIALASGHSVSTVKRRLDELGLSRASGNRKACPFSESELRGRFHAAGSSQRALAAQVGVSVPTLVRWLQDAGISTPRKRIDLDHVEQLLDQGLTQREIAAILGCSSEAIRRARRRAASPVTIERDVVVELLREPSANLATVAETVGIRGEVLRQFCVNESIRYPQRVLDDAELTATVFQGGNVSRLAASAGQPLNRVYLRCKTLGLTDAAREQSAARRNERRELARAHRIEGRSAAEIAAVLGVNASLVRGDLRSLGVPSEAGTWSSRRLAQQGRVARGLAPQASDYSILEALSAGIPRAEIASTMGVGYSRIYRLEAQLMQGSTRPIASLHQTTIRRARGRSTSEETPNGDGE